MMNLGEHGYISFPIQRETLGVGVPFGRCSDDELCRLKVVCLEYFDFVRVSSETVLSVCAIAEGLVAGVSAPTVPLRYLSIDDDKLGPFSVELMTTSGI